MKIEYISPPENNFPYLWIMENDGVKIGVKKDNGWCIKILENIMPVDSEERCVPLIPIVEIEKGELDLFLRKIESSNVDYSESIMKFPSELILRKIFHNSFSGYWPERALAWLEYDKNLQCVLKCEIVDFSKNKIMPQMARQKAKKILKKIAAEINGGF